MIETKVMTEVKPKVTTKVVTKIITPFKIPTYTPPPPPPPPPPVAGLWLPFKREPTPSKAFRVELKRFGEFIPISKKALPKGRALRLGAMEARRTLGATFRIVPTEKVTSIIDIPFRPSPLIFRGYKIEAGKKIPLENEFIQFAKKRLSARGEVREIMAAKLKAPRGRF